MFFLSISLLQPFVTYHGIRTLQPLVLLVGFVSHQQFQAIYTGVYHLCWCVTHTVPALIPSDGSLSFRPTEIIQFIGLHLKIVFFGIIVKTLSCGLLVTDLIFILQFCIKTFSQAAFSFCQASGFHIHRATTRHRKEKKLALVPSKVINYSV